MERLGLAIPVWQFANFEALATAGGNGLETDFTFREGRNTGRGRSIGQLHTFCAFNNWNCDTAKY